MYTSGSTGRPKGVGGHPPRRRAAWCADSDFADLGRRAIFLQLAPISFDASTLEIWAPLLNGGRLARLRRARRPSLAELAEAIARLGVTSLWLTAGLFHQMVDDAPGGPAAAAPAAGRRRRALAAARAAGRSRLPGVALINGYGPTESTTFTCCFAMTGPEPVAASRCRSAGRSPTRASTCSTARLRPVPVGVPGRAVRRRRRRSPAAISAGRT